VDFYQGKVLTIDLSAGTSAVEPLNMEWAEKYIGGKGLLLRYLWELVPAGIDPWAPENPIVLMTGPFAGTGVCTGSRLVVGCKSPITGVLNDSYVGGSFAPELKFAGYDAVVIIGQAPAPVVVTIADDVVSFLPAEKYWGLKTSQIEAVLRADFDPQAKTLSIGPAGENEIPCACLSTDQFHKAGRGGHGALMGRKNLKAIAVRGTGGVAVGDARAFLAHLLDLQAGFMADNLYLTEEGTLMLVDPINAAGAMPTRNWSSGSFEGAGQVNSEAFGAVRTSRRACSQCSMACRQWHEAEDVASEGPEYETVALCGPNCGVGDIPALMRFNAECDEWGLDTISAGAVVGLAMDLTERGVHDFGLRFGELEGYVRAPALMARREGIGAELALGARALGAKYGHPELAVEVKNLELPGYDPRGAFGMSLAYATSDRGGCHMRSYTVGAEVLEGAMPPDSLEGKAALAVQMQDWTSLYYSGIWCANFVLGNEAIGGLLERVWRRPFDEDEIMRIGARIWNLARLFNLREAAEPDEAPAMTVEPAYAFKDGPSAGRAIGQPAFKAALQEFYQLRGWDENGIPREAKLAELGVDVRL
jgi:aldehyde:ferredoxin oxidoreductase